MKESRLFSRTTRKTNFFRYFSLTMVVSFMLICVSQNVLALTKPTLQSPANNAQITTTSITFSWSHPYNDKYEVKIKTSGGTLQYASGKISSKSKTVNLSSIPLTSGSTYKWYVVVYANGQEISSSDSWFTYKSAVSAPVVQQKPVVSGRVDLSGGVNVSPSSVTVGQNFTVSFNLKEFQGGTKTLEYVQLWIQNSSGGDLYTAQQWSNVAFAANQQRSFSATTSLNPAQGRGEGTYRAIVRGKIAGEAPFNFGVVSSSGGVNPKTFTAVAAASPPSPSPSQPQPSFPAPAVQPKPVVSGRVDLSGGVNVSPSSVTVGQNFTVSFNLKEFQGGTKTFEYVQLWIQNSAGEDLYSAQQWNNVAFAANQPRSFSATSYLNPAQVRSAGTYRAIVRGKVAGDAPFNFGVVSGSSGVNPRTFTAVAAASTIPPSPSPVVQPKPVVSGRVDLSDGVTVSPSSVTIGQNFTVSFYLKEFQGGTKTLEYVQLWIQNSSGGDLYTAQQWSNVAFAANQQRSFSATTSLNPAQGRSAGTYRVIVRGKVEGEVPFNFGVVSGSGGVNPRTFTAVATASTPPPSQVQLPHGSVIASDTYDYKNSCPQNGPKHLPDKWNFYQCECTSYVADKLNENGVKDFNNRYKGIHFSDADTWIIAAKAAGISYDIKPKRGDVAWFPIGQNGHVAYVEDVDSEDNIKVSDYNVKNNYEYNIRSINKGSSSYPKYFIHIGATASPPPSSPSQSQPGKSSIVPSGDQQKPVVSGFDVKKVGNTVSISYRVTDSGGSGLKQVELWRSPNNQEWAEVVSKRRSVSGSSASGSFSDTPPSAGTFYYGIHAVDQAGNWDSEHGPKNVTVGATTQSFGSVSGRFHKNSASGALLSGVSVIGGGRHVTTDGNGYFKLERISAGNNSVSFTKSGYETYQATLNVPAGETLDVGDRWLVEKGVSSNPISSSKSVFPLPDNFKLSNYNGRGLCDYPTESGWHTGIDIPTPNAEPAVKAVCKGKIIINNTNRAYKTKWEKYWNAFVVINHDCDEDGEFESFGYYGHLISNKYGSVVAKGEIIGSIRMAYKENDIPNPGNNHLHFGYNKTRHERNWGYFGNTCDDVKKAGWEDPIHNFKLD